MKNIDKLLIFTLIVLLGLAETTLANPTTKSFAFGAGSANPTSVKHTFSVPCQLSVKASIRVQRAGGSGAEDVDIVMDLMSPGSSSDEEGPVESTITGIAKILPQNFVLRAEGISRGCNLPWTVRLKTRSGQPARAGIAGQIYFSFDDRMIRPKVGDDPTLGINLNHGQTVTVDLGDSRGFTTGSMVIEGEWANEVGIFPIKMKFELIDPAGAVVASGTGYSKYEINPCCQTKLNFRFTIRACSPGQWKLRIKNLEDDFKKDAVFLRPKIALTSNCP